LTHKEARVSAGTVNRELAVLSHLLNKAIEWRWIDRKPAKISRFKEENARITYLTVDQVKRLVMCARADGSMQIYPFIVIGLETSMRAMEILSIQREHIDLEKRSIYIPHAKAGARMQPITSHLAEFLTGYLAALPKGTPWLFPRPRRRKATPQPYASPFAGSSQRRG
jgi:integrase